MTLQKIGVGLICCLCCLSLWGQRDLEETVCQNNVQKGIRTGVLQQYNRTLGYVVWMNPAKVKSGYFIDRGTYPNVYSRITDWTEPSAILVSTSGNYVNKNYHQSIGLTVDRGKVLNKTLARDMDGLVVTLNGSLTIFSVQRPFKLPGQYKSINASYDKTRLLQWAQRIKASVFQTHLLAFDNALTISTAGNKKVAKRKFLATVYDKSGNKQRVLFYLQKGAYLQKAAKQVFDYLRVQGYHVQAMVNLDTGGNDILTIDDTLQRCNNRVIRGFMSATYATNLLVFYNQ
ncbi:MAG: hypothetical protein AAF960_02390 [Bacteroidota bacterium]